MNAIVSNMPDFLAPNGSIYNKAWGEVTVKDGIIHISDRVLFKMNDSIVVVRCDAYPDVWLKNGLSQRVYNASV